jgi:predicted phage baseplate assembly protein
VGAEALSRVVSDTAGFQRVRNPLAGSGGTDAESMEEVRQFAPQAFRTQERAVTEDDWAAVAERHPEVQKAAARFRWFGSWYTVVITIDRAGGLPVKSDENFLAEIERFLEQFRIAGYDLEINDPVLVPLDILLKICVKAGYFQSDVKRSLTNVFSRYPLAGGGRGFFHPDNFTFGQPVYLSKIYQTAMGIAGVASVEALTFQRFGKIANNEIDDARLVPASLEIVQLDNDPNFPEHGRINFEMHGGL